MSLLTDFAHLQIPLEDILSGTNNFADENLIREGGFGKIYKGDLLRSGQLIDIVARRLDPKYGQGNKEFLTEISMLSNLKHPNLVSFIGFCDENEEKIIVNKHEANLSLDKYLSEPTLTWLQRLQICASVARTLSYIYYDKERDFSIIHRNIKSSKILLDHKWEPKLSGFELSVKNPVARKDRLLITALSGTYGYVDPACEKTGGVTHKSDLFSLGVVLFEILCGRRAYIPDENEEPTLMFSMKRLEPFNSLHDGLLSSLAKSHYEEGKLDDLIKPDLRKQMEEESYKIFSETAYYCLKEQRTQRPDIDEVVRRLERALTLQGRYDNNLQFQNRYKVAKEDTSSSHWKAPAVIAKYSFLSRHPPAPEQLPFPSGNPLKNQANGNIMYFSLHEFADLQIPLEDVLSATSNFADENILVHGGVGKLYRGQLKQRGQSIDIVARRLGGIYGQGEIELWTEISMLSSLKHTNLVSIVGFCDENGEKIIIYEHAGHGCLDQHLSHPALTWSQRLQICLGVAHALTYIHYDVVHGDIRSSNILIDKNWEAKVFGFGLSTKFPGNWEHRFLFSHYFETSAYRDPVYTNTLSMTPKYDVYSFGVLLYDVLCGGKPLIIDYGVLGKLDDMIDPHLRKQIDTQSLTIFWKTAYSCLNRHFVQRPSMDEIVKELENVLELQRKPENLEHSTLADEAISSNILTKENIERLKIPLSDIRLATNNFHHTSCIGSGGFGRVYKAELDHLDIENISSSDWENSKELPKKRSIVAIKRIFNQEGEEGFFAEIETLTSCKHPNIVSLLGFSSEDREMILIFEFALKGSLDNCLVHNNMANVTWAQRLHICLDIARGLDYLHANLEGKRRIVHRDVKSANILLDEKWNAKVADFGLSKFHPANQQASTVHTVHIVGTEVYLDPEFLTRHTYKKESDIYSFGVVLFEILCGTLAYNPIYSTGNDKGLPTVARRHFNEGKIKELIDPDMMEEASEHIFTVNKGPTQKSLDVFAKIAYQCLAETQVMRPKMDAIIKELQDALKLQGKTFVLMKFRLSDIVFATNTFAAKYCIGVGAYGMMYNAKLDHYDTKSLSEIEGKKGAEIPKRHNNVAFKRIFNREDGNGKQGFFAEIETLASFKHPNIVSLLGVSSENREMIIIYEDAFRGSLHDCLGNAPSRAKLTWAKRIQISLDIAHGWNYLQTSTNDKQTIMQFDMNSANILLDAKWRAKIACFWLSTLNSPDIVARKVQTDPEHIKIEKLKNESSIYSFGVILFEILCGKLQYDEMYYVENEKGLPTMARRCFDKGTILNDMIDPNLMEETDDDVCILSQEVNEDSFKAFLKIAYGCCAIREADRPSMEVIIKKLKSALTIQEEHMKRLKAQVVVTTEYLEHLKIPLNDILKATDHFSEQYFIGSGGYATVYKAELSHFDGRAIEGKNKGELPKRLSNVAIKRISRREDKQGEQGFFAELETLSKCKHPNIISLVGFCNEDEEMIIVVEYASNGSLEDIMGSLDGMTGFNWVQRIQICLDIAHGLNYIHTSTDDKQMIIHRDVKSANIVLGDDGVAKIIDFGLSRLNLAYRQLSSMLTMNIAGTNVYLDPEYMQTGRLKKESDIYSFGVVLCEIMCGSVAYDKKFHEEMLPSIARKCFEEGTLKQIIDPRMREDDENIFMQNGGLNQDSLDTFSKIAYQCIAEKQRERPNIQVIIRELEKAYYFQKNNKDKLHISLEDIQLMTENFSDRKCIGEGRYWKQYEGEMAHANGYITVIAKRFNSKSDKQRHHFLKELETLFEYKHKNIIGVAGYCQDMDEKIIVYEQPSNGRLSEHLDDASVTWMKRLKICIDIACGMHFLHRGGVTKDIPIMHRDIKSASILLEGDWTAKISNLEFSLTSWEREEIELVTDKAYGSLGYLDPEYEQNGYMTQKSDIYSLGVVLLEMLCGRLAWVEGCEDHSHSLGPLAKQYFKEAKLDELVFKGIKEQINPDSLATFADISLRCLIDKGGERPEADEVVIQLKKAVEFQEDFDVWEPKLPRDYEEILHLLDMDKNTKKKDIYNKLCKGVLLEDREVCLSLGSNGEKRYMISAKRFSYKNRWAINWQHIPQSRFENVAEMFTLSNLKIKVKIRTLFLSPGVNYGVHLVFKFGGPRKFSTKPIYVNLMYKMGSESFHAYFATWRDEEWMTIELCRYFNGKEDTYFQVLLESFSLYYCGRGAVYVEGIEFRVTDNVKQEKIEKTKEAQQVLKLISDEGQMKQLPIVSEENRRSEDEAANKFFLLKEVNKKKQLMLPAKEVLYDSSNVKRYYLKPSTDTRFQEVIEVLPHQVLRINCKIQSQMLSQDTEYSCYLVFKLSEKCRALHCPVKVRDLPHRKNKEVKHIYFRSPDPWNLHDFNHIPEQREDGWMEVNVWNFNSNHKLQNDCFWVNLKLISYEGTIAGLIVCGLEFRPT